MFNREYTDKEINTIINSLTILVDNREKVWSHIKMYFKSNKIEFIPYTLSFGDYSCMLPQNVELNILEPIYFNEEIVIERKACAEEISGNFTEGRDRFKREFERGNNKIRLLIEDTSYADISKGNYDTKFNSKSFIGSLHSFQEEFNAPFFFTNKEHSGEYIYNTFKYYLRNKLKQK